MTFISTGQNSLLAGKCMERAYDAKQQQNLSHSQQSAYYRYTLMMLDRAVQGKPLVSKPTHNQIAKGMTPELAEQALVDAGEILVEHLSGVLEQGLKAADTLLIAHTAVERAQEIIG